MDHELEYNDAIKLAIKKKHIYLTEAIEGEDMMHLKNIDLDGWDQKDRREAYLEEVLPYWEKYGIKPKQFWFELNGSRDHRMDPRFLPTDLYFTEILPYMNNGMQKPGLMNKSYYDYLFTDVKQPDTVVLRIEGSYLDQRRNIISEKTAAGRCLERKERLFIKKSIDSAGGSGISILDPAESTEDDVKKIFCDVGANFIVQEEIKQHPVLRELNPSSVCTIRVLSLMMDERVYIESAALRISPRDIPYVKIFSGGFSTEIMDGGRLHPKVYSDNGRWFENGNGLFDENFKVPAMDMIYDEVKRIHPRMGHFKCIGWDFAVDLDMEPVLIEPNAFPMLGCTQITPCRPVFNDRTDWILDDYFHHRTWEKNHRQDILIQ